MPMLFEHRAANSTKLLLMGDTGTGKTGALVSLAEAGYKLRIIDFDNGMDVLTNLVMKTKDPYETASNIIYETLTDQLVAVVGSGKLMPKGTPKAFSKCLDLLTHWKIKEDEKTGRKGYDLGPITSWDEKCILVIDSLTHMCNAAMRMQMSLAGRPMGPRQQSDWGEAQNMVEAVLAMLYDESVKCSVIINSHVSYFGGEEDDAEPLRGLPTSLGKALSPKIGSYFNNAFLVKVKGQSRVIRTVPDGLIAAKSAASKDLPAELPLETGLAEAFRVLRKNPLKLRSLAEERAAAGIVSEAPKA